MVRMRAKRDSAHFRKLTQHGLLVDLFWFVSLDPQRDPTQSGQSLVTPRLCSSWYYLCRLSGFLSLAITAGGADTTGGSSTP